MSIVDGAGFGRGGSPTLRAGNAGAQPPRVPRPQTGCVPSVGASAERARSVVEVGGDVVHGAVGLVDLDAQPRSIRDAHTAPRRVSGFADTGHAYCQR